MEQSLSTDQEERELKQIGRQVARALGPSDGRALAAARRKLFEPKEERGFDTRWLFALGGVAAAAAVAFALRTPATPPGGVAASGQTSKAVASGAETLVASDRAKSHTTTRPEGAKELVLEEGEARGRIGRDSDTTSVAAGPYRVSGDAKVVVTWSPIEGLTVDVSEGEARVLAPGRTTSVITAGQSKKLPAK